MAYYYVNQQLEQSLQMLNSRVGKTGEINEQTTVYIRNLIMSSPESANSKCEVYDISSNCFGILSHRY